MRFSFKDSLMNAKFKTAFISNRNGVFVTFDECMHPSWIKVFNTKLNLIFLNKASSVEAHSFSDFIPALNVWVRFPDLLPAWVRDGPPNSCSSSGRCEGSIMLQKHFHSTSTSADRSWLGSQGHSSSYRRQRKRFHLLHCIAFISPPELISSSLLHISFHLAITVK